MGMYKYPMFILVIVILLLAVKKAVDLFGGKDLTNSQLEKGLHAIIFWGAISAVFGILGQITGIYNALNAIIRAEEIDPRICAAGFAQSFTTSIFGLNVLMFSAIVWFVLLSRYRKRAGGSRKID